MAAGLRARERWLADAGSVDLRPGGSGRLVDDGVARRVEVETVDEGARVVFRWWDEDHGEDGASRGRDHRPAVDRADRAGHPRDPAAAGGAGVGAWAEGLGAAGLRWEVRLACLAFLRVPVRV